MKVQQIAASPCKVLILNAGRGHTSTLCDMCKDGYKKINGVCTICEAKHDMSFIPWMIMYTGMFLLFVIYMLQLRAHARKNIFDQGKMLQSQSGFMGELVGTIRILIGFLQVFSSFESSMAIPWPPALNDMMGITNAINIDLSDIFSTFKVCNFVTSFENTFITYMLFLPAIFLIAATAAIVLSVFDRKFKMNMPKR